MGHMAPGWRRHFEGQVMKRAVAALMFAGVMIAIDTTDALAWYCRAESRNSYGWGTNYNLQAARRRALWECARRTPRRQTCYIAYCR
jgi:hypothetical protein